MTAIAEVLNLMNAGRPSLFASQEELDELGLLLDRLDELEVYYNSPSISKEEKEDTWTEMESVMERIDIYVEKV